MMRTALPRVLMYHAFAAESRADDPHGLFLPRARLRRHLQLLSDRNWSPLDLDGYLAVMNLGVSCRRRFLVTIDDGYRSVLDVAASEFASAGVKPVLLVPPGLIGRPAGGKVGLGDEELLSADELVELVARGFELGVHGLDHATMAGMTNAELRTHTVEARNLLADLTGSVARSFAYPLGVLDDRAVNAVRTAGYSVAFSVTEDRGRWGIPRTAVASGDSERVLQVMIAPWYELALRASAPLPGVRRCVRATLNRRH